MVRRSAQKVALAKEDILEQINAGLKKQIARPNLYAYVPHDKQYLFHTCNKKVILYIGGNRSGKTTGGAVETIYRAMGRHPYKSVPPAPTRGRVHSVDFDYGVDQIILPEIQRWLPPSFLLNGSWEDSYDKEHHELTMANKSTIEFKSYAQDLPKFAGTSRHYNWYDEEPPKHIYNESQARLIDTDGEAYITMTPVDGMTWTESDIYTPGITGLDENIYVVEIDMAENPYLTESARLRYLATLDPEERKARERGEFVALGGKIFKQFNKTDHVIPFFLPDRKWEWYASFDHGFNNPTAILWHAVSPDNEIVTFSEHYKSEVTVDGHSATYHARNAGFGRVPDFVVGDPAMRQRNGVTGTSIVQEYADRGIFIGGETSDVDSGLNRMLQYLKVDPNLGTPRWKITENCINLISEMSRYRWATYSSRKIQFDKNKQEKPQKKDDHAVDSARYFFTLMPDLSVSMDALDTRDKRLVGNPLGAVGTSPVSGKWDELLTKQLGHTNWDDPNANTVTKWNEFEGTDTFALEY